MLLPAVAGLAGLVVGWVVTHGILDVAGYAGDPSRGAAFTGAGILGVASASIAWWLVDRASRTG
jgi:hypothetical protein